LRVEVPKEATFLKVSSCGYASDAIDHPGRLWAWGDTRSGQLGVGTGTTMVTKPASVGIHRTRVSLTAQKMAGLRDT
jgi:alpha-tubulin suppressor-like RCC1 family protein